jgi:hypothetical protein
MWAFVKEGCPDGVISLLSNWGGAYCRAGIRDSVSTFLCCWVLVLGQFSLCFARRALLFCGVFLAILNFLWSLVKEI